MGVKGCVKIRRSRSSRLRFNFSFVKSVQSSSASAIMFRAESLEASAVEHSIQSLKRVSRRGAYRQTVADVVLFLHTHSRTRESGFEQNMQTAAVQSHRHCRGNHLRFSTLMVVVGSFAVVVCSEAGLGCILTREVGCAMPDCACATEGSTTLMQFVCAEERTLLIY